MTLIPRILRYAAFSDDPNSGNPAGVVLNAEHMSTDQMQDIAAEVGYSETAFATSQLSTRTPITVRYFAPDGEVDFCGHATIATAVAIGRTIGFGTYTLDTRAGLILASARSESA